MMTARTATRTGGRSKRATASSWVAGELLHAHATEPFTRSETITVPDGVDCVVVRGHDQTHGYGGQAMLVAVPDGETATATQGSEWQSFAESDCP